ncbi:orotidine-5'-phosphate decarboxylase [Paucibacter sp. O1-1]|nr:orotidine-5'-phosphate decarboxylase [Paucibacter sp. O1-1]MDA3829417.1 orotidine-5'-phosphate decarboxylase [Paucibacter sp. O1-1]
MNTSVIVALDLDSREEVLHLVQTLGPDAMAYKVGLQLLTAEGSSLVRELVAQGKQVFLDLKLHEIPSSVAAGVSAAGRLGATMVTVHASAGSAVLRAAVEAAKPFAALKVLALTVITSLGDEDLPEIGLAPSVREQVMRLAHLAAKVGCHGLVASAQEAAYLRDALPAELLIVTPGIQFQDSGRTEQTRVATPDMAARLGASHVVMGRAIVKADAPGLAFSRATRAFEAGRLAAIKPITAIKAPAPLTPLDKITLRLGTLADAAAIFAAHRASVHALCAEAYSVDQIATWFEGRSPAMYAEALSQGRIWLAESGAGILGFVGVEPGEVTLLFVRPDAAGIGLGQRLLEQGLLEARRSFEGPLSVVATINSEPFYARFGFVAVEQQAFERGEQRLQYPVVRMLQRPYAA